MNIYVSGISGTAMGALALFLREAGSTVFGSDKAEGAVSKELAYAGIEFEIGEQNGSFLMRKFETQGIDWFVYTSALPKNHPELVLAKELGIKVSKRDELIAFLTERLGLKMVAIAGTHGKTTTTAMIIWTLQQLGVPVSWLEGTTLGFASAGGYTKDAKFLIYEADEYDRNFLTFYPWLAVITVVDYDHPDIYPTELDYKEAFARFERQSEMVIRGGEINPLIVLPGEVRRKDASLALTAVKIVLAEQKLDIPEKKIASVLNNFPGAGRRFEKIADYVYSDYAHHPEEIKATVNIAREEAGRIKAKGVAIIYEPHQNIRQHKIMNDYKDCFVGVDKVFWLPTFLTREDPNLRVLSQNELIDKMENKEIAEAVNFDEEFAKKLKELQEQGILITLMSAGPADAWLRKLFGDI